MYRTGHYGVSLLCYAPVWVALLALDRPTFAVAGLVVVVGLAPLPDYDQSIPFVRHRGPTHTFAFAWVVGLVLAAAGGVIAPGTSFDRVVVAAFGLLCGLLAVTAHLAGDVVTPAGIEPFWPFSRRNYSLDLVTAANPVANYGCLALGVLVTAGLALALNSISG